MEGLFNILITFWNGNLWTPIPIMKLFYTVIMGGVMPCYIPTPIHRVPMFVDQDSKIGSSVWNMWGLSAFFQNGQTRTFNVDCVGICQHNIIQLRHEILELFLPTYFKSGTLRALKDFHRKNWQSFDKILFFWLIAKKISANAIIFIDNSFSSF